MDVLSVTAPSDPGPPIRVGLVGTGFVASAFARAAARSADLRVTRILTRRSLGATIDFAPATLLTRTIEDLVDHCDVVLECAGDTWHASDVVRCAFERRLPVATLDSQFHVTVGSYFVGRGCLSECEGDQPGSLAVLATEAVEMGFRPLVYGSMKGFLDRDPTPDSMRYWAGRQGISLPMVTAFTDGTKLDLEHVLIANGLGATIVDGGMVGWRGDSVDAVASGLADIALGRGAPITDYVLSPALPHGVFIAATHDAEQAPVLKYLKCGDGPIYVIVRPAIYGHLQALRSVRALARDRRVLLDNTVRPRFSVGATAKRDLDPGERIAAGVGSFELRGRVVHFDDEPDHMPIGLVKDAIVVRALKRGDPVAFDDLELPAGLALDSWCALRERAHDRAASDRPARAVAATADGDQ